MKKKTYFILRADGNWNNGNSWKFLHGARTLGKQRVSVTFISFLSSLLYQNLAPLFPAPQHQYPSLLIVPGLLGREVLSVGDDFADRELKQEVDDSENII